MKDEILKFVKDEFKIDEKIEIDFREIYGLTFVIKKTVLKLNEKLSSAEVKVIGIIYEENDEYYFAPLDKIGEKDPIIEEFVEKCLK
jgi:hypothetical protein